ncbi:MAG: ankyrin repeat domain-containing protein, partial [Acidiferrobacterales bacterium]
RDGTTPLMAAAHKGYSDLAKILVDCGADINARDRKGNTAMAIALNHGYTRTAELLKFDGAK